MLLSGRRLRLAVGNGVRAVLSVGKNFRVQMDEQFIVTAQRSVPLCVSHTERPGRSLQRGAESPGRTGRSLEARRSVQSSPGGRDGN